MKKVKIAIIIIIVFVLAAAAARGIYMHFFKTYVVGEEPRLNEITYACYTTGSQSSDYGYIYDEYTVRKKDQKYYAGTDIFDKAKKEQVVTELEITGAEYNRIIKLLEGCSYIKQKKTDTGKMDGFLDESSYHADIIWDKKPGGAGELSMDPSTRAGFSQEISKAVLTISVTFTDEVEPSSVWIIRDIPENRKTSIWGTAMIKPEELGKEYEASVPMSGDDKYLFRMIDEDGLYYETEIPQLQGGWKLKLYSKDGSRNIQLDVYNEEGELVSENSVFSAAL